MSKDLYKNSLLVVLLLFFYYKQKEDIDVYLNIIMNQFSNIKYIINNYLSIILNDKNKKIFKKKIDYVKTYFFKKNIEQFALKEETKNIVEIVLPEKINIKDIKTIDLKETKKSNSILNILLNKYIILSVILAINYYKRKLINKPPINSNKKLDELDILNEDIKDKNENEDDTENKDNNEDNNENNNENENKDNKSTNSEEDDDKSTNSEEDDDNINNKEYDIINNKIIL